MWITVPSPRFKGSKRESKKPLPRWERLLNLPADYFLAALRFSSMAACAAASRATGTRYGEQLT